MISLVYIGLTSFFSTFLVSHSVTTEILTRNFNISRIESKTDSKVKFKQEIRFKTIPNRDNIPENTLNELWYSRDDYKKFKKKFFEFKAKAEMSGVKKNWSLFFKNKNKQYTSQPPHDGPIILNRRDCTPDA